MFYGQANQDKFVVNILKDKMNGFFLEIGSNHPIQINNTYILEKNYNYKGIMIEYNEEYLPLYKIYRPNSYHIINDATKINYKEVFNNNNVPFNIDYLQIDLEVSNGSTLRTLEKLNEEVFDKYKFATITFEHDIYATNFNDTRAKSREIFNKNGYICVFKDISNDKNPYEDWYVHPELVDMNYITILQEKNNKNYKQSVISYIMSINYNDIEY